MTPTKKESRYEKTLLELIQRVSHVMDLLEFDDADFKERFKELPFQERLHLYGEFAQLQQNLLETLRRTFPSPKPPSIQKRL